MSIQIFKDMTTEDKLVELESKSESYIGLYVDMDDIKQRSFVKGMAADIKGIRKLLNSSRIKKVKDYTFAVKSEFDLIDDRLSKANEPFTLLIDDYNTERAEILAAEKAKKLAIELEIQKGIDHESAITLDRLYELEYEDRERKKQADIEAIKKKAKDDRDAGLMREREAEEARQQKLLADRSHVSAVRGEIKSHLMQGCGIDEETAIKVVKSMLTCKRVTVNY